MCRVNKICCSYSQDVLYRDIFVRGSRVQHTLAQSTHLAKKVRSFESWSTGSELAMALRNMTSLRNLILMHLYDWDILDGCTFKLDFFDCDHLDKHCESFIKFLSSQPSLKAVTFPRYFNNRVSSLEATFLPNLTRTSGTLFWLQYLIPGRPLNEVIMGECTPRDHSVDLSFLALSTTPIQRLAIDHSCLCSTPVPLLASFLPSLTHFMLKTDDHGAFNDEGVCDFPILL
jgi:hypothetical protein